MFVLAGCGYVIVQGQTLYGGMIYRPLYEVCPLFFVYWGLLTIINYYG